MAEELDVLLDQEGKVYSRLLKTCEELVSIDGEFKVLHDEISHANGTPRDKVTYYQDVMDAVRNLLSRAAYQERRYGERND